MCCVQNQTLRSQLAEAKTGIVTDERKVKDTDVRVRLHVAAIVWCGHGELEVTDPPRLRPCAPRYCRMLQADLMLRVSELEGHSIKHNLEKLKLQEDRDKLYERFREFRDK